MNYEPANIRRFLQERFDDEELNHLCFDYFPDVHNDFTVGMRKGQKVQMLLEHCQKQGRWPAIEAALERERPQAYAEQFTAAPQVVPTRQPYAPVKRNPRQIFISHAHQDAEFAHRLVADLETHGWQTWIAPDSIRPGEKWLEAINRGLEESGFFLLLLTPHAVRSRWVRDETNVAIELMHDGELTLLPLLVEPCNAPPLWRVYQQIPFQDDYKAGLQALLTELQPEMMAQLAQQYRQLRSAMVAKKWQQARTVGEQIEALYSDFQDVPQLIVKISKELQLQQAQEKELASLYWQLQAASEAGNWDVALALGKQIQALDRNYRDVIRLLAQAEVEVKRQERQSQLAQLYGQLQEAVTGEDWNEAIVLGGQIQRIDQDYRDVSRLLTMARKELRQMSYRKPISTSPSQSTPTPAIETPKTEPPSLPATPPWSSWMKAIPLWGWGVLVIAIIGFSIWGIGQLVEGNSDRTTPVVEATRADGEVTTSLIQTRTPKPDPAPTKTAPPSPTGQALAGVLTNTPPLDAALHDTWTRPADGMVMVYVPGGKFMMGSDDSDENASDLEKPQHEVTLDSFWIDRAEVTNAQYELCVSEGACNASYFADDTTFIGEDYPVVGVSWEDADDYCSWAEAELPTEAQWEYAARGDDGRIYPWGNEFDGSRANYCDANCTNDWKDTRQDDGYATTAPVSSFSPAGDSWVDAADMAGNVWEWIDDWYGDYSSVPQTNPTGPGTGDSPVIRGGGWGGSQVSLRLAYRVDRDPDRRYNNVGFRCAVASGS